MAAMARSGSRSEWERQQAAQRREAERWAREQSRLAKEREKQLHQQHLEAQQRAADAKATAVERQIKVLDEVLTSILPLPPSSFERLQIVPKIPDFDPGPLGIASPMLDWNEYAPIEPSGLGRMFGGAARYERRTAEARIRYEAAMSEYRQREDQRQRALAAAKTEHERKVADIRAKAAEQNTAIDTRRAAFASGDAEAVEWFVGQVLDGSRYPDGFPRQYQVAYRPENRDVVVEFELPPQQVIPAVRGYKYVKQRDAIDPLPRPENEIKQRYARLIACVALRTLHEISPLLLAMWWRRWCSTGVSAL